MWAIRILTGPQAGQIFNLKPGRNRFGRSESVDFQLGSNGISKEHFEINVTPQKVTISDLQSSNGTFVNGVKVQSSTIRVGDKISAHNIIFDLVLAQEKRPAVTHQQPMVPPMSQQMPPAAYYPQSEPSASIENNFDRTAYKGRWDQILEDKILPAIHQLAKVFDFKMLIFSFVGIFVFVVTLLSLLPMHQITSETIDKESRRRAITVARSLASANEKIVRQGDISKFSTDLILREEGISDVYIVSKDGTIVAPSERAGMRPREAGFVNKLKGQNREFSERVDLTSIAAGVPILTFDPEFQQNVAKAYAVVIYNTGTLSFDDGRAVSLFVQMLLISLLVGGVLFFVLYKAIEYPFVALRDELNDALINGKDHADVQVQFPVMEELLVSVNSILGRLAQAGGNNISPTVSSTVRDAELSSLVQIIPYPALLINKDKKILAQNYVFEQITNISNLSGQGIEYIPDQAMQKNIIELLEVAHQSSTQTHTDQLEINGQQFVISCQAISASSAADYYIVMLSPNEAMQGGAA